MSIEIRKVSPREGLRAGAILDYALDDTPQKPPDEAENLKYLPYFEDSANLLLYSNGELAAGAYNFNMTQNIRGQIYDAGGVWSVATLPEYRRRGYTRRLMSLLLENARDDRQVFSNLYPFKESFYERMGYVVLPAVRVATFDPNVLVPLIKQLKRQGSRINILSSDAPETVRNGLIQLQKKYHGMMLRPANSGIPRLKDRMKWVVMVEDSHEMTTGMMMYTIKHRDKFIAHTFLYENAHTLYQFLEWIARHTDQVNHVEVTLPPDTYPETWFSDMDIKVTKVRSAMGRILDVERLNGMSVGEGKFSAQIYDALCPWNNRTFQFEAVEGVLQVTTAQIAGCDMDIAGLSALIYGTLTPDALAARRWTNARAETLTTMANMFPMKTPHIFEEF